LTFTVRNSAIRFPAQSLKENTMRTIILTVAGLSLVALHPAATQQPAAQPTAAPAAPAAAPASPASQLGLYVFPSKDQTKDQQLADEQQCWAWAKDQTKIDPATLHANTDSAARAAQAKTDSATKGAAVGGAARGAVGGAAIGAIAGDAGTGAAIGAAAGAVGGRRARKQASAQAAQAGAASSQQQVAQQLATFKKAMTACLEGRGYSVK
jgi:hypothetical protein